MNDHAYDVAIIGGGPAGSTAATLLARAGRRVIVLERDKFPRFHIGESLLPFSMKAFTRLGVHEKFLRAGFMEKFGGDIAGACCDTGLKFYFKDGFGSQTDRSYQVTRADFDKVLLDHARENGAEVLEETGVEEVTFTDSEAQLVVKQDGVTRDIHASYVIDASGRNSVLGNKFRLKQPYHHLKKVAIFAHYDGVSRDEGIDGTLTRMVRGIDRWFWSIPLTATRTSIGVVLDGEVFRVSGTTPEIFLANALSEQPLLANRMAGARRVSPVHVAADFSYRNSKLVGARWLLAGDAAGFIDPVFSSGVFLGVLGGEMAADILHEVLSEPAKRAKQFAKYERAIHRAMDVYLRFVESWYTKEFTEVFLSPRDMLRIPQAVNAVLGGNIGTRFAIKWRMEIFYLFVRLQKHFALCPRLTLVPKKSELNESDSHVLESAA